MEALILEILTALRTSPPLDEKALSKIIHKHNKALDRDKCPYSKKRLLPYYLKIKESHPDQWMQWNIDEVLEKKLFKTLQIKPRRTASGVATITVITKPWKCSSDCVYCPNDLRMPKSYLSNEPACQRAERNYFDPYLQVVSRLRALTHMGHVTDKIELIVLGGTWSDYSQEYQVWYIKELFRALNDGSNAEEEAKALRKLYKQKGIANQIEDVKAFAATHQRQVDEGTLTYNQAFKGLYEENPSWQSISVDQTATMEELKLQHQRNENAEHRVVGLVVETRPDLVTIPNLTLLRTLGCTKIQMGIQSLDPAILKANKRNISLQKMREAFGLLRLFGFKIHAHFMVNLYGSSPEQDVEDYRRFVTEKYYLPDEVKLYPCALIEGTRLCELHDKGAWNPYSENELLTVLTQDVKMTPPFIRISRVIRDFSSQDIVAGNKKANLRQLVENRIVEDGHDISEIRSREISTSEIDDEKLTLNDIAYTTQTTEEHFLQWITPENKIAGFLRLSLPNQDADTSYDLLPINTGEAMIREVHVYGRVAKLHTPGDGAQHLGLGKQLIEHACKIAKSKNYDYINVISSIGTREYYRNLDFSDNTLYQQKLL